MTSSDVQVYLACDREYVAPAAVTIASIESTTSSRVSYHVLTHEFPEEAAEALKRLADVDIVEVGDALEHLGVKSKARIASPAYYRLLIPKLAKGDRCVYTDVDVVFADDIAKASATDLDGMMVGAVRDVQGYSFFQASPLVRDYWENVVGADPKTYFCSGFLVMDLNALRLADLPFLETARSYPWAFHDMDVLNHLLVGSVKMLDSRWVVMPPCKYKAEYLSEEEKKQWQEAQDNPAVYHYAGDAKPWNDPLMWESGRWWSVAKSLPEPLYQESLALLARSSAKQAWSVYNAQIASLQTAVERLGG